MFLIFWLRSPFWFLSILDNLRCPMGTALPISVSEIVGTFTNMVIYALTWDCNNRNIFFSLAPLRLSRAKASVPYTEALRCYIRYNNVAAWWQRHIMYRLSLRNPCNFNLVNHQSAIRASRHFQRDRNYRSSPFVPSRDASFCELAQIGPLVLPKYILQFSTAASLPSKGKRPVYRSTSLLFSPIQQCLKSAPQEDLFYVAMFRYVSCFPSCQVGFFNVEYQLFGD